MTNKEKLIELERKILKSDLLSPFTIGKEILELLGDEVSENGFGYNSLALEVRKDGVLVHRETIGE